MTRSASSPRSARPLARVVSLAAWSWLFGAPAWSALAGARAPAAEAATWSPPAVPLIACDPYFSVWSTGRRLTDAPTTHWTGRPHPLESVVTIDERPFRLLGAEPAAAPPLPQVGLEVTPTRSIYRFVGEGVAIELTFLTPLLPEDIDLLARPVTYVSYAVQATDGRSHRVQFHFAASGLLCVNDPAQSVAAVTTRVPGLAACELGMVDQRVLGHRGDDIRIEWGYLYVAAEQGATSSHGVAAAGALHDAWSAGQAPADASPVSSLPASDVFAWLALKPVEAGAEPSRQWLMTAYDDLYSIEYMGRALRPYWRRDGLDAPGLLQAAARDYSQLAARSAAFDAELTADLTRIGGAEYAQIAALAYRQCFAAGKFVADAHGQPLQFCKENHSNGCIATSDVFYPMSPQFLLFGPSLAKSFVVPFMNYAASERWKFPFAPHDLGTYPKANGQVYGGGERTEDNQMPVEESGNLLILMAAIARMEGHAEFASLYWPQLEEWASYLKDKGFDPENQLCTDDFAGHLAHNVNLSAKAICGLGSFALLCEMRGDAEQAHEYRRLAEEFAARWVKEADDGDHFRLAFDKPGTWSQKYNLVWDRVLGLQLFPDAVLRKEMDYYLRVQNRYGLPLDNRQTYTKLDWILWTATLTRNAAEFRAVVEPGHAFLHETPDRVPMTDWYQTDSGRRVGFTARPVVGGVFMQALHDGALWRKWAERDVTRAADFAPMPRPPRITAVVAAADTQATSWQYTTKAPADDWMQPSFDDAAWSTGPSGFGTPETPGARIGSAWRSPQIWLRRKFELPEAMLDQPLKLHLHHDEDAEVYVNGVLACRLRGYATDYVQTDMSAEARATLRATGNVLAVTCRQTSGGQYIDVGIALVEPAE